MLFWSCAFQISHEAENADKTTRTRRTAEEKKKKVDVDTRTYAGTNVGTGVETDATLLHRGGDKAEQVTGAGIALPSRSFLRWRMWTR